VALFKFESVSVSVVDAKAIKFEPQKSIVKSMTSRGDLVVDSATVCTKKQHPLAKSHSKNYR
jgi:hypothetical protein